VNTSDEIRQQVTIIASRFGFFDCIPCARAVIDFLVEQGIQGKQIKLDTGSQDDRYGRIYDDSVGQLISTTGYHEGVEIEINGQKLVFDNLQPDGIIRSAWISNLYTPIVDEGGQFQIAEIDF
jgi:Papain fold toxin 2